MIAPDAIVYVGTEFASDLGDYVSDRGFTLQQTRTPDRLPALLETGDPACVVAERPLPTGDVGGVVQHVQEAGADLPVVLVTTAPGVGGEVEDVTERVHVVDGTDWGPATADRIAALATGASVPGSSDRVDTGVYRFRDGTFTAVNTGFARLFDLEPAEMVGRSVLGLLEEGGRDACRAVLDRLAAGEVDGLSARVRCSTPETDPVRLEIHLTLCEGGPAPEFLGLARQIAGDSDGDAFETVERGEATTLVVGEDLPAVERVRITPLGDRGVLVTGAGEEFPDTLTTRLRHALDRGDPRPLRGGASPHEIGQPRSLASLHRRVASAVVDGTDRPQLESDVCAELAATAGIAVAWIGGYDSAAETLTIRTGAGDGQGYLDAIDRDALGTGPGLVAARTREAVTTNIPDRRRSHADWQVEARRRGYEVAIAVPVTHTGTLYGVLTIFARDPAVVDGHLEADLAGLGEVLGHGLDACVTKEALLAGESRQARLAVPAGAHSLLQFVAEGADRGLTLEGLVPGSHGELRGFYAVSGANRGSLSAWLSRAEDVLRFDLSGDGDPVCVRCRHSPDSFVGWLLDRGAVLCSLDVGDDDGMADVRLPGPADLRQFVEALEVAYPGARLVATGRAPRASAPTSALRDWFERELTTRQREVVETAYHSGYFETPRAETGSEVAETLGISQPTFSDHLRAAERRLLGTLFDREAATRD